MSRAPEDETSPFRWIEQARQPKPRPKFPFVATINGERVIVWPDWFEHEEEEGWPEDHP
jgi:hypothetical protein